MIEDASTALDDGDTVAVHEESETEPDSSGKYVVKASSLAAEDT